MYYLNERRVDEIKSSSEREGYKVKYQKTHAKDSVRFLTLSYTM